MFGFCSNSVRFVLKMLDFAAPTGDRKRSVVNVRRQDDLRHEHCIHQERGWLRVWRYHNLPLVLGSRLFFEWCDFLLTSTALWLFFYDWFGTVLGLILGLFWRTGKYLVKWTVAKVGPRRFTGLRNHDFHWRMMNFDWKSLISCWKMLILL